MDTTLMERTLFSIYDVSIEHPKSWKLCFDPKRGVTYNSGFFRIEDFVPKKGAQLSLSLNWEAAESTNEEFAENYYANIRQQYARQLKRLPMTLKRWRSWISAVGRRPFVVSEYRASLGLVKRKSDAPVRVLQLAFYDEESGRAVVSSLIGRPDNVRENEEALRELVFSVSCGCACKSLPG